MSAPLPQPRGPVSDAVISTLAQSQPHSHLAGGRPGDPITHADPLGGDLQLALYVCYELHYRGFSGVDDDWEWDPQLLAFRGVLEERFLNYLRGHTGGGTDVTGALDALSTEPVDDQPNSLSHYLAEHGTWAQLREFFVHRSLYHLKEADPHAWAIPRLVDGAKAAFVAVEFDEFGGGRGDRMHSTLFAALLRAADLDATYLGYIDCVPPEALATVNFMSLCGLHRGLRGALVGLFAAAEITTAPSAKRIVAALDRLDGPQPCRHFYTEHIEADAVHEQVLRHDVVGELLRQEPELAADVIFGIEASEWLEARLADHVLGHWRRGVSSLLPVRTV
ncbi:iron-containing redox enzyme family protein [Skermania sp. ID1734]|uniref:iron-containing redox enzyme family protein n=1 Tax=Skermania sp. ID1734 TaxID=2597516 RepID=UPI0021056361|nr:iron-containing redox enzyme family protein [Skermania sp. ID1734]